MPVVTNVKQQNGKLQFRLSDVPVSTANAIRRTCLSEIEVVALGARDPNLLKITNNGTALTNEMIAQRLSFLPVYIDPVSDKTDRLLESAEIRLSVVNDGESVRDVTTNDIEVVDRHTGAPWHLEKPAFPVDDYTQDPIIITRIEPAFSGPHLGIDLRCRFIKTTPKQHPGVIPVSLCTFVPTPDPQSGAKARQELKSKLGDSDDASQQLSTFDHLEKPRYTIPKSFDFRLETIGPLTTRYILLAACDVIKRKLQKTIESLAGGIITRPSSTIPYCAVVTLKGEDFTLGKILETVLYEQFLERSVAGMNYCGFNKPHPHIDESVIRMGFDEQISTDEINTMLVQALELADKDIDSLRETFAQLPN